MRKTACLKMRDIGITLFTRESCSLCENAKHVLQAIQKRRNFRYVEIDVMKRGHETWKVYEFDVPVILVQSIVSSPEKGGTSDVQQPTGVITKECGKLMHRFTEDQVENLMDVAEKD